MLCSSYIKQVGLQLLYPKHKIFFKNWFAGLCVTDMPWFRGLYAILFYKWLLTMKI